MKWIVRAALAACLAASPASGQMPSAFPRTDTWTADAPIDTATSIGSTLYLGGQFNQIGPLTGSFALVDAVTGAANTAWPQVLEGDVLDIAADGAGGWYLVGSFQRVGGLSRNGAARIRADHTVDPWAPTVSGEIRAVAVAGDRVFLGGVGLYEVDAITGVPATSLSVSGSVDSLVAENGVLYVGGSFTSLLGAPRMALGAVDLTTNQPRPWNPAVQGNVSAMLLRSGVVYIGGSFSSVAGQARSNVAALDAVTGTPLPFNPAADASVYALAASATTLYLGGRFANVAQQPRAEVAAVALVTGQLLPFQPLVQGAPGGSQTEVMALALGGSDLYLGGTFGRIAGQTRRGAGAVDAVSGQLRPWNPRPAGDASNTHAWNVNALEAGAGGVAAGGRFRIMGGGGRVGAAAIDLVTGTLLPWQPAVQIPTGYRLTSRSMAHDSIRVFISGRVEQIGSSAGQDFVSAFDGITGAMDQNFVSFAQGISIPMMVAGSNLCLPCRTTGGISSLCGLDLTTGDLAWSIPTQNALVAMVADDDNHHLYVVLGLSLYGVSLPAGTLDGWSVPANQQISALGASPGRVVAGGGFTSIGGVNRGALAAVDVQPPAPPAVASWAPLLGGTGGRSVNAIAVRSPIAYIAGSFQTIGGAAHPMLAGVNLFSPTACLWWPAIQGNATRLVATPSALAVIGPRATVGDRRVDWLLVYNLTGCTADADANCLLNANDFIAFQSLYASGSPAANCDRSTTPPVLNVNDFICFIGAFAAGCP